MEWPPTHFDGPLNSINEPLEDIRYELYSDEESGYRFSVKQCDSWPKVIPKKEMPIVYNFIRDILPHKDLPKWVKSSTMDADVCLDRLAQILNESAELRSNSSIQAIFGRAENDETDKKSHGVLYLGLASAHNLAEPNKSTTLSLHLFNKSSLAFSLDDKIENYIPNTNLYREYNVLVENQAQQFLQMKLTQRDNEKDAKNGTDYSCDVPIAGLVPYKYYNINLSFGGDPRCFITAVVCFIPMTLPQKHLKPIYRISNFRVQPQRVRYDAGDVVRGTIHFTCSEPTAVGKIAVRLRGTQCAIYAVVPRFSKASALLVDDARVVLGPEALLQPGFHCFPFEIGIPKRAPRVGNYSLQAVVSRAGSNSDHLASAELSLWITGPQAPKAEPSWLNLEFSENPNFHATIEFPSYAYANKRFPITLYVKKPSGSTEIGIKTLLISVHESFIVTAEVGLQVCSTARDVFKCKMDLDPSIATKTADGISFPIDPTLLVEPSCDRWESPLGVIEHVLKFTLETVKGNARVTKTVPLEVYQTRANVDAPVISCYPSALLYKPSENDFEYIPVLAVNNHVPMNCRHEYLRLLHAKVFQEVSAVPPPSGWTLSYPTDPEAASAKDITFPESEYLHAMTFPGRIVAQHDPASIPAVSVFHFGEITPGYPARKPLKSSSSSSSSSKKKKKNKEKKKVTEESR